jgi:hypothetical protein
MIEELEKFNARQIDTVNKAVTMAEELVGNAYKLSVNQWLRNRYDIKTLVDLNADEIADGPFAQIVRYRGRRKNTELGSATYDFYKICLHDHAILSVLRQEERLRLMPFCLYIITHELIHIVRFSRFLVGFNANKEEKMEEESQVHKETHRTLAPVQMAGLQETFDFYKNWREPVEEVNSAD